MEHARIDSPQLPAGVTPEGILAAFPDATMLLHRDWRIVYANPQAIRLFGNAGELVGRAPWEIWASEDGKEVEQAHLRALKERTPVQIALASGEWLELRASCSEAGVVAIYREMTPETLAQ